MPRKLIQRMFSWVAMAVPRSRHPAKGQRQPGTWQDRLCCGGSGKGLMMGCSLEKQHFEDVIRRRSKGWAYGRVFVHGGKLGMLVSAVFPVLIESTRMFIVTSRWMTDQWIWIGPCIDWEQCLDPLHRSICFNRTRCAKLFDCQCKNGCLIVWFDFVAVQKSIASICGAVFARFCSRNAFSS